MGYYAGLRQTAGVLVRRKIREVRGNEHVPKPPYILAANHMGYLDAPAMTMWHLDTFDRPIFFLTKRYIWRYFGQYLARHWLAMVPVADSKDQKIFSLKEAEATIRSGNPVCIYPESTRNQSAQLLPGKTGAVRLALATNAPLIPVGLVNTTGDKIGTAIMSLLNPKQWVDIRIGTEVDLSEFKNKPIDKPLLTAATRKLMQAISGLCGKVYNY